jgi:response regulator of citrate/malate metabolism
MNISETELLDAIREATTQASARPDGALTITEMADATGLCRDTIRKRIRPVVISGRMECIPITTPDMTGRPQRVPGYRLIAPPKKKGKR